MASKKPGKKIAWMKRESVILTPELKAKVEEKVKEVVDRGNKIYKTDLPYPEIRWDLKSRVGGMAYYGYGSGVNYLRFHAIFAVENEHHYVEQTVPHEVAHNLAKHIAKGKKIMSHGNEWRDVMVKLGVGPKMGEAWNTVIKHLYNPSSLALPERKKHGPRKAGGKNVGEILAKIKKLKPAELEALKARLGFEVTLSGEIPRPPTKQEIQAGRESFNLHRFLENEFIEDRPADVVSVSGWAHAVIKNLKGK